MKKNIKSLLFITIFLLINNSLASEILVKVGEKVTCKVKIESIDETIIEITEKISKISEIPVEKISFLFIRGTKTIANKLCLDKSQKLSCYVTKEMFENSEFEIQCLLVKAQ